VGEFVLPNYKVYSMLHVRTTAPKGIDTGLNQSQCHATLDTWHGHIDAPILNQNAAVKVSSFALARPLDPLSNFCGLNNEAVLGNPSEMEDELPLEEHLNLNIITTLEPRESLSLQCSCSTMTMVFKHTTHSNTPFKVVLRR